jgi:hypothetical protein
MIRLQWTKSNESDGEFVSEKDGAYHAEAKAEGGVIWKPYNQ